VVRRAWSASALAVLALVPASLAPHDAPEADAPLAGMTFTTKPVSAAESVAWDLYEPAVTVASTGAMYVSGHAPATATKRAEAFVSLDDGDTWAALPGGVAGGEGVIATDDKRHAWMLDNGVETATLYGWCDDGAELCTTDMAAWDPGMGIYGCGLEQPGFLDDRPWVAYGGDQLVLVNNGNGVAQVGLYDPATGARRWNMCAGTGWIPGPPAVRADGVFAVPMVAEDRLAFVLASDHQGPLEVLWGTDPAELTTTVVFPSVPINLGCGTNYGFAGFSAKGTLWVAAATGDKTFAVAASKDGDLARYRAREFDVGGDIAYLWLSASPAGEGALVSWATTTDACLHARFYVAHLALDGVPRLRDVTLLADDVIGACGDYSGNALGPDGRAYVAVFSAAHGCLSTPGERPLTIYVQEGGPRV
jgi:hypothetical protein